MRVSMLPVPRAWCRFMKGLAGAALLGALVGCAGLGGPAPAPAPARETLAAFELDGRFALRQGERNFAGRLSWRHVGTENVILLSSPFGQGLAEIVTGAEGARLTASDGKIYRAPDGQALVERVLGYPLPIERLADWLRARAGEAMERDAQGRVVRLREAGWDIRYEYDDDSALAPPGRLLANGMGGDEVLELRLRVDRWTALPQHAPLSTGNLP